MEKGVQNQETADNRSEGAVESGVAEPCDAIDRQWPADLHRDEQDQSDRDPQRIVGDWVVGGALRFESEGGDFDGEVLAYEEPALLAFRWGTNTIRLEIEPHADGCTLTLIDTIEELGKAARDGAGWHVCLDRLDGSAPSWTTSTRWREIHPGYVESFGPQAATIGPPDGAA